MRRTARKGKDRPEQAKSPNWKEFVRLAHQAVVAIVGTGITNGAEPRACGLRRVSRSPDIEPGQERNAGAASNEAGKGFGRAPPPECGSFQPDWGKLTVRDDKRGWRKRRQDLMAICHEARKG